MSEPGYAGDFDIDHKVEENRQLRAEDRDFDDDFEAYDHDDIPTIHHDRGDYYHSERRHEKHPAELFLAEHDPVQHHTVQHPTVEHKPVHYPAVEH